MKEKREAEVKRGKLLGKRAGMSYLQIFILILSSFAFCYAVAMADSKVKLVSAEETNNFGLNCCQVGKNGDICSSYPIADCANSCSSACLPSACGNTQECKEGCCYNSAEGLCVSKSSQAKCTQDGGIWKNSPECNLNIAPECKQGCCVLGENVEFVTSGRCQKLSADRNLNVDFRSSITSEENCLLLKYASNKGACVFNDKSCKMLTNSECRSLTGRNIFLNVLCTAEILNTTCKPTQNTKCVDGKDEVYFVDSCGNTANIYDSSRKEDKTYWERVFSKFTSCGALGSNINSRSCGNCDRFIGSGCSNYKTANTAKPDLGENLCKDLGCKNAPYVVDAFGKVIQKKDRKNGETWCVYDGKVGDGDDIPGSRHFKYSCIYGEVKEEPCADARNEICVENGIGKDDSISNAVCRANNWRNCFETNFSECNGTLDCQPSSVVIDKFKVQLCTPKYPGGFGASEENQKSAQDICSQATRTCVAKYAQKGFPPKCVCVENCDCEKATFTQQMNGICRKLGDCGGEANIAGVYSKNYVVKGAPNLANTIIANLVALAVPRVQRIALEDMSSQLESAGINQNTIGQVNGYGGVSQIDLWNSIAVNPSGSSSGSGVSGNVVAGITGNAAASVPASAQYVSQGGTYYMRWGTTPNTYSGFSNGAWQKPITYAYDISKDLTIVGSGASPVTTASGASSALTSTLSRPPVSVDTMPEVINALTETSAATSTVSGSASTTAGGAYNLGTIEGSGTAGSAYNLGTIGGAETGPWSSATTTSEIAGGMSAPPPASAASAAATAQAAAIGGFVGGIVGGIVGNMIGSALAKALGLNPTGSFLMSMGMGMIGSAVGMAAGTSIATGGGFVAALQSASIFGVISPLAILVVGTIMIIASLFFGGGKCKPHIVTFTCQPWQAPVGASDCSKCNADTELKPCSKYRCESLGKGCQIINEGTGNDLCISMKNDGKFPGITPWTGILNESYSYVNISQNGFKIRTKSGDCITAFSPLMFGINTDKASQCKIDLVSRSNFESMENDFGGSNIFMFNHSQALSLPSPEALMNYLNDTNITYREILNRMGNLRMYVRCQDNFGNYNPAEYVIETCVKSGADTTPPMITYTIPANNGKLKNNQAILDVNIGVSEPANCKWSKQDKNYTGMENIFTCETDIDKQTVLGWNCNSTLTSLTKGENIFYFRCIDQPWLAGTVNESKRNANSQSFVYKQYVTDNPLVITRVSPNGTLKFGGAATSISFYLGVETSGGAENGKAFCSYSWNSRWIMFLETGSNVHRQNVNLPSGNYNIPIRCEDVAGNIDEKTISVNLEVDASAPGIIRVYNSGGSLYILTNENSDCAYTNNYPNCGFIFTNGTQMNGGFTQEHTASWDTGKTYYIKCRDAWGNEPSSCSIRVKAYNDVVVSSW